MKVKNLRDTKVEPHVVYCYVSLFLVLKQALTGFSMVSLFYHGSP